MSRFLSYLREPATPRKAVRWSLLSVAVAALFGQLIGVGLIGPAHAQTPDRECVRGCIRDARACLDAATNREEANACIATAEECLAGCSGDPG